MEQEALNLLLQIIANSLEGSELPTLETLEPNQSILVFKPGEIRPYTIRKDKIVFPGEPITTITGLSDTPNSKLGQKGKVLIVSQDEQTHEYKLLSEVQGITDELIIEALGYTPANDVEVVKRVNGELPDANGNAQLSAIAQVIDLGDILTDTIQDAFNDETLVTPITIDIFGFTKIKAIQNNVPIEWIFTGAPETYNGTTLAIAEDFFSGGNGNLGGSNEINITSISGWADYSDTQYNSDVVGQGFAVASGAKVNLPNNGLAGPRFEMPTDLTDFYDGNVILGKNGDAYSIMLDFKVRPTSAAANIRVRTKIDIGGTVGEIYPDEETLTKGNGTEHYYRASFPFYTLGTWAANGGTVKVEAIDGPIEIYGIRYVFFRLHKAGNPRTQTSSITVDQLESVAANPLLSDTNPVVSASELEDRASAIKEHEINGVRETINVSGTYALDWNAASVFDLTMTAATTFLSVNLPTGTNSKIINIELTGSFVPTFPTTWVLTKSADAYDGTKVNQIQVNCINGTVGSEKIRYNNETLT